MKSKYQKFLDHNLQYILSVICIFMLLVSVVLYAFGITASIKFIPLAFAIIASLMLWQWDVNQKNKLISTVLVLSLGFIFAFIGDKTIGGYIYNPQFGYKLLGVSVAISILWLMITLSAWQIGSYGRLSLINKFLLGGALVVIFDLVLEQMATSVGLWNYPDVKPNIINYITWFIGSQIIFYIYYKNSHHKQVQSIFIASILPLLALFMWLMIILS